MTSKGVATVVDPRHRQGRVRRAALLSIVLAAPSAAIAAISLAAGVVALATPAQGEPFADRFARTLGVGATVVGLAALATMVCIAALGWMVLRGRSDLAGALQVADLVVFLVAALSAFPVIAAAPPLGVVVALQAGAWALAAVFLGAARQNGT